MVPLRTTPRRKAFKFQLVELVERLLDVICRGCTMYIGGRLYNACNMSEYRR